VQPGHLRAVVTFFAYTILILGGPGRVIGPVVGSVIFWFLVSRHRRRCLRQAIGRATCPTLGTGADRAIRFALVGLG
jgi:neutral amino acid transport system permease protein